MHESIARFRVVGWNGITDINGRAFLRALNPLGRVAAFHLDFTFPRRLPRNPLIHMVLPTRLFGAARLIPRP
jgi:hypothetical protein